MHSVLEKRKQGLKQYIAIGKTNLFYSSMGLCGNFTASVSSGFLNARKLIILLVRKCLGTLMKHEVRISEMASQKGLIYQ